MAAIRKLPANAVVTATLPGQKKTISVGNPTQAIAAIPKYPAGTNVYVSVPSPTGTIPQRMDVYMHIR
jgi:hypothetical protein